MLQEIYNFRAIGDDLGTAGQPTENQLKMIKEAGFTAVINLALATSDLALPHEGSTVAGLGMTYVHIPVDFQNPTARDFQTFCGAMEALSGQRVFVHCAANMRVSTFVFLHRVVHLGIPIGDAESDLHAIWQPNETWSRFIREQLHGAGAGGDRPVEHVAPEGIRIRTVIHEPAIAEGLADVLLDCVAGGASIGFMEPLARATAMAFWQNMLASADRGERILLVAEETAAQTVVGTVQVVLNLPENQPHRADLAKMQVHRRARARGVGAALVGAAEAAARQAGRTLLVLDTVTGSDAERLYTRLGWQRCGSIPDYALWPQGGLCSTTIFYRSLTDAHEPSPAPPLTKP